MESVWSNSVNLPEFKTLEGDIKTDVLIIGGGLAGILCAYFLSQKGVNYVLAEADCIGSGITKNTTAKITSQHGLIYDKLIKNSGKEKAQMYYNANHLAVEQFRELCKNISCDFENKDSFVYTLSNIKKIENEINAMKSLSIPAEFESSIPLPISIKGAIKLKNQAQFNPLKFINSISSKLNIYEKTFIKEIQGNTAKTEKGNITAKKIIVATHFPFINKHGSYFLKLYQHRSYLIALENAPNINGMYVDEAEKGMTFRNYKNLLLVGGGDHRTGKKGGGWQELRNFSKEYYPHSIEKFNWASQDCMSLDSIPYIGHYSKNTHDLYVATGFNKWGMTSSMVSAMILSDMVMGKTNEFSEVFSPHRNIIKPQLFVNAFESTIGLITPTTKRCSHMGCALKWNKCEHTWDCPCHGSRFDKDGEIIDNPSIKNLD